MNPIGKHASLILLLGMVAVATLGAELVLAPASRPLPLVLAIASGLGSLAIAGGIAFHRASHRAPRAVSANTSHPGQPSRLATGAALALLIAPALAAFLASLLGHNAPPLELIILAGMRNLALGLAALAISYPNLRRITAVLCLFLILCLISLGEGPAPLALTAAFTLLGCLWLVLDFWLSRPHNHAPHAPRGLPWLPIVQTAAIVLLPVLFVGLGPAAVMNTLAQLVASSGGTGDVNPDARAGVDDGPNEVAAAQNPRSIGFADSDVYLESDRHSLYDAFNEQYGEPKKNRQQDRSIAISSDRIRQNLHDAPEDFRTGQSFSTRRNTPQRSTQPLAAHDTPALAYYSGPTPAHIPLTTFSTYNGTHWAEESHSQAFCPLQKDPRSAWMHLVHPVPCSAHADPITLNLKIGQLQTPVLPIPAHAERFRVGSIDRTDFFLWAQPGLIRVAARAIPKGTVIQCACHSVDPECLRHTPLLPTSPSALPAYLGSTQTLDANARRLALAWTRNLPPGWIQVEAVVRQLRLGYIHDPLHSPNHLAPPDQDINQFLNSTRSGPDYLFASAATLLLRELGYPTRLTAGLYAPPSAQDSRSRQTPLSARNIHFWAEVLLPSGHWIAIEPTPGYELLPPVRSWSSLALAILHRAARFLAQHPLRAALLVALLVAAWLARNPLRDALATFHCHLLIALRGPDRKSILATFHLLETRSRLAGRPRGPALSPGRWLASLISADSPPHRPAAHQELHTLAIACNHACYAPSSPLTSPLLIPPHSIQADLRRAIAHWSRRRFKHLACAPAPR